MKTLVAGWFSFGKMGATAGDLLARDLACQWLKQAGRDHDVALASPFRGGVHWKSISPKLYSQVVFVCGPFGNGWPIPDFLKRFKGCRLIGLNLSMVDPIKVWNPFDLLLERDSTRTARPDISFLSRKPRVPVVGVILVHPQREYRGKGLYRKANGAIRRLLASNEVAAVPIDTRLDVNRTGLRTASEVESIIARMDVVVTTRLHGCVLALKNGVPPLAIDPIPGGAKIRLQAKTVGWPVVFTADKLSDTALQKAFDYCLTKSARTRARACRERAIRRIRQVRDQFIRSVSRDGQKGGR